MAEVRGSIVIPYVPGMPKKIKKIANEFVTPFSLPNRLGSLLAVTKLMDTVFDKKILQYPM